MDQRRAHFVWLVSDKQIRESNRPRIWKRPDACAHYGIVAIGVYYHHPSFEDPFSVHPERVLVGAIITALAWDGELCELELEDFEAARPHLFRERTSAQLAGGEYHE